MPVNSSSPAVGSSSATLASHVGDHYFSASPASAENLRRIRVTLAGSRCRGDDRRRRLQPRSRRLGHRCAPREHSPPAARRAPAGSRQRLGADRAVARDSQSPHATVWAVDVNERALDLVRRNAEALGLDQYQRRHCPTMFPTTSRSARSARTRRSASARTSCTDCSSAGSRGWTSARMPGSSCSATSARTRCSGGSRRRSTPGYSVHRAATGPRLPRAQGAPPRLAAERARSRLPLMRCGPT